MKKIILILILLVFIIGCVEKQPKKAKIEQSEEIQKERLINPVEEEKAKEAQKIPEETKTSWSTFHGDSARTGFSTSKPLLKANVLWKWTAEDFMNIGYDGNIDENWPIIDDNKVFFAIENIFAFELKTGNKVWSYAEEGNFYPRGLTAGDGKLFVTVNGDDNYESTNVNLPPGFVYALNEKTGKFLWKFKTDKGIPYSLPLFAENKVFIGDNSGSVYAIDADDGKLIWKKQLEGAAVIHSSPAYDNGLIFIGTENSIGRSSKPSHMYSINPENGKIVWKFEIDIVDGKLNLIHSTPSILDGKVYFGAENGYFYVLLAKDGSLVWKQKIASGSGEIVGTSAAAALGYDKIYIGTFEGRFLAINQNNGKVIWEYNFGKGTADSSPVLADGKVYFGAGKGDFYSFDADNGNIIWKEKLGGSSAALADGILIVNNARIGDELQPKTPIIIAFSDNGEKSVWQ